MQSTCPHKKVLVKSKNSVEISLVKRDLLASEFDIQKVEKP